MYPLLCDQEFYLLKDMGSEMFELCDTSHYFVFRRVELVSSTLKKKTTKPKEDYYSF